MRIINFIRRLFRRTPADVGQWQVVADDAIRPVSFDFHGCNHESVETALGHVQTGHASPSSAYRALRTGSGWYADWSLAEQVAAGKRHMQRYYDRLQQPPHPGEWSPGGPMQPGDYARGGLVHGPGTETGDDSIPAFLSHGGPITDPDHAEALGLTVEARRLREQGDR
ncbi:MAG TPA: hypothetical protein VHX38_02055 [Pseudonocardiaceae bacterium]|jgi:hypothetical protein|nr:hypothetical protein [Pseudonocardiaceae bacterium]